MKNFTTVLFLVCAISVCGAHSLYASDYTWTGAQSTDWAVDSNWSPVGNPTTGDNADVGTSSVTATISSGDKQVASLDIYNGGVVSITGGSLNVAGNLVLAASSSFYGSVSQGDSTAVTVGGGLTFGGSGAYHASYVMGEGATLTVGNFAMMTSGTQDDSDATFTMGADSVLNVGGNLDFDAGNDGGCNANSYTHLDIDPSAEINMTGDGTLTMRSGCTSTAPEISYLSAAASGKTTTLADPTNVYYLELGPGTLEGNGQVLYVCGTGTPLTFGSTEGTFNNLATLGYMTHSPGTVNVATGNFNGVEKFVAGLSTLGNMQDQDVVLTGDIGSAGYAPNYIVLGMDNDYGGQYKANVTIGGNSMTAGTAVAIGYSGTLDTQTVTMYADATATNGAQIAAGDDIRIFSGSSLALSGSTTLTTPGTITVAGTLSIAAGGTLNLDAGTFTVADGGMLKGAGTITGEDITIAAGGIQSPGDSPGIQTIDGQVLTWDDGGILNWEIYDTALAAGVGWDLIKFINGAELSLAMDDENDPFQIHIYGLTDPPYTPGDPKNFDYTQDYLGTSGWRLTMDAGLGSFNADYFSFTTHDITGVGGSNFSLFLDSGDLYLNYTSPEPSTVVALILGAGFVAWRRLRKRFAPQRARRAM